MHALLVGFGLGFLVALYAAAGAAGAAPLLETGPLRVALGLAGAAVLLVLGARTPHSAFRVRSGLEVASEVAGPRRAFLTSVAGTASNPSTIASWAAIFAAPGCWASAARSRTARCARTSPPAAGRPRPAWSRRPP